MKTKNKRELEKYWAEQAARKAKLAKKQTAGTEDVKPTDAQAGKESGNTSKG